MTPLSVMIQRSDHGDVHQLIVARSNGDSLTIQDYVRVVYALTGHDVGPSELDYVKRFFEREEEHR